MRFKNVSQFLKKARKTAGLSQSEVASSLGYTSPQFISNWERGLAAPPLVIAKKLARIYRVEGEELLEALIKDTESHMRKEFRMGRSF